MKNFVSNKNFKFLILTLCLVLAFSAIGNATEGSLLSSLFGKVTVNMQKVSATVTSSLNKKSYEELEAENKALVKEIANLRTQLVDYYDVKQENTRLWKYYDLKKDNPKFEFMPANVIRRDPNDEFYSFTVDAGTSEGVSLNDPVVTENGLVGYVSSVSSDSAKITTILNPDISVGALDRATADSGVISGDSSFSDKNYTTLKQISSDNKIKKGDIIITTGIGGIYPADLIVGEVKDVRYDQYDSSKYALIKPYDDIRSVTDVVIITAFSGQGEIKTKSSATVESSSTEPSSVSGWDAPYSSGENNSENNQ
ncbi:MAG: rod shape-determining protein MreC [Acutalibacteraceae bacterium]